MIGETLQDMAEAPFSTEYTNPSLEDICSSIHILRNIERILYASADPFEGLHLATRAINLARQYYSTDQRRSNFVIILSRSVDRSGCQSKKDQLLRLLKEAKAISAEASSLYPPYVYKQFIPLWMFILWMLAVISTILIIPFILIGGCCSPTRVVALILCCFVIIGELFVFFLMHEFSRRIAKSCFDECCQLQAQMLFAQKATSLFGANSLFAFQRGQACDVVAMFHDDTAPSNEVEEVNISRTKENCFALSIEDGLPVLLDAGEALQLSVVAIFNQCGRIQLWNDGASTASGFCSKDVVGLHVKSLLLGASATKLERMMCEAESTASSSQQLLTLAHSSLGSIPTLARVICVQQYSADNSFGRKYALVAAVCAEELMSIRRIFANYFSDQLFLAKKKSDVLEQLLQCMRWDRLQDICTASQRWKAVKAVHLFPECCSGRKTLEVTPQVEQLPFVLCDVRLPIVIALIINLFKDGVAVRLEAKRSTDSVSQLIFTFTHDMRSDILDKKALLAVAERANEFGAFLVELPGTIKLIAPFFLQQESIRDYVSRPIEEMRLMLPPRAVGGGIPLSVLLVQQNSALRSYYCSTVQQCGHFVQCVGSVSRAVDIIDASPNIGCVIIDATLLGADGVIAKAATKGVYIISSSPPAPTQSGAPLHSYVPLEQLLSELDKATEYVHDKEILGKALDIPLTESYSLGRGRAEVFQVQCLMAVKKYSLSEPAEIGKFVEEVRLLSKLSHPNIIRFYRCARDAGDSRTFKLYMEYGDQGTLRNLIQELPEKTKMQEKYVAAIMKQLLSAVSYVHARGIIHRDIKPENLLIAKGRLKLCDFDSATTCDVERVVGTIEYMAPEVINGKRSGKASDIWSVGGVACACLRIMLRGDRLIGFRCPELFPTDISSTAIDFIKSCMRVNPHHRSIAMDLLQHAFITQFEDDVPDLTEAVRSYEVGDGKPPTAPSGASKGSSSKPPLLLVPLGAESGSSKKTTNLTPN